MNENINTAEQAQTAVEEKQTVPTGTATENEGLAPEENAAEINGGDDIDIGIDVDNYPTDGQPERLLAQRAKEKGMTVNEYLDHVANLENEAEINRLVNDGYTREEAIREAKYSLAEKRLKALEEDNRRKARYAAEVREFQKLYPDVDRQTIPKQVWEAVSNGADLSSAYAKYERVKSLKAERAAKANAENGKTAAPKIKDDPPAEKFFTMDEIRRMSRSDVKKNYEAVMRSLGKK